MPIHNRTPQIPALGLVLTTFAVVGALVHLLQAGYFLVSAWEFQNFHLGFALILLYVSRAADATSRRRAWTMVSLSVLSLGATLYVWIEYESLISERVFEPNELDVLITIALVTLTLVATRLEWVSPCRCWQWRRSCTRSSGTTFPAISSFTAGSISFV